MDTVHHTKLTARERDLIAIWKGEGVRIREIARRLGRSHSTIIDEIRRNSYKGKYYVAIHAQAKTDKRKYLARKRHPLKNSKTYSYVIEKLEWGWSPEEIAGRLRKVYGKTVICTETIYSFIYSDHPGARRLALWQYLPRKHKKRRKKYGRRVQKGRIPERVSIHSRPAQVDNRRKPGHWEGDTMEGRKIDHDGVHTDLERLTRKVVATKIKNVDSDQTIVVQTDTFGKIPSRMRKTITYDNGKENVKHQRLHSLGIDTYFADAHSPWQKGAVEYAIGLLRRYLPKGTSLKGLTQEELDDIVEEINNRPRKVLNYNTPNEVYNAYVNT